MMRDAIVLENLGKRYTRRNPNRPRTIHEALLRGFRGVRSKESFWALRNVSFRVPRGMMLGIIGRNGAGKSTLLQLIGAVERPDEGLVKVNGRMGALLTLGAGFHPELTGRENVFVSSVVHGLTRAEVRERFGSIVEFAGVEDFIDDPVRIYSSGMAMRLRFAVAVHMDPEVLLIDEVLSVGDAAFQRKCMERIDQIKARGSTVIFVSHGVDDIRQLCDEAIWIDGGHMRERGDPWNVVDQYLASTKPQAASPRGGNHSHESIIPAHDSKVARVESS